MPVSMGNVFNKAHGGALTSYVDVATTCALFAFDKKGRSHVSTNLNIEFLSPATTGPTDLLYYVDTKVLKIGGKLGFTEAVIRQTDGDGGNERIVARGTHTLAFLDQPYKF